MNLDNDNIKSYRNFLIYFRQLANTFRLVMTTTRFNNDFIRKDDKWNQFTIDTPNNFNATK